MFVQSQETANVDILSVSTIATCASIFSSSEDQTQLCGPNGGNTQVGEVLLNININEQQAGATSLIFNAFPSPGTTLTNENPTYPCGSTPFGQNCTTFGSPITVIWKARPTVGAYQLKQIVSGIPLNYLMYFSPLVVDVDDEDLNWRLHPNAEGNNDKGQACQCRWYDVAFGTEPQENDKRCVKCPFAGSGAFVRGNKNSACQDSANIGSHPACGQYQVDTFCSCGGFPQECAQNIGTFQTCIDFPEDSCSAAPPNVNGNDAPCICFPFNPADFDNCCQINQYHSRLLKQGGMHQTNAFIYVDDECRNGGAYLNDDNSVLNFNNAAVAACRKMAYFMASQNSNITLSQIPQFVKFNGPCADFVNSGGCGPPSEFFEVSGKVPSSGCPTDQECFLSSFFPAIAGDINKCTQQTQLAEDTSCYPVHNCDTFFDNAGNCGGCPNGATSCSVNDQAPCTGSGITARFGANAPLGNLWAPQDEIYSDVCLSCRADYTESSYLPGLWGNQRKCKLWIDDWRECFIGSYYNAFAEDFIANPSGGGTLGFNYYSIPDPSNSDVPQTFILQPDWCMQMLGKCNAASSGDTCWSSYNQPADFCVNPYYSPNGGITTQGFEKPPLQGSGTPTPGTPLNWQPLNRGLALTPYWMTPVSSQPNFGDGGHTWHCGQGCDPDYSNSYVFTSIPDFPAQNPKAVGTVKGMTGVGPLCTAYEVSIQGLIVSGVDFTFEYVDANGNNQSQTMTLTTDNIGTGSTYNTLNLNGTGAYGRIININSPSSQTLPVLGGVLVVCGVDGSSTGEGALNGNLDVTNQAFSSINPWNNLVWLLQSVEQYYKGITGYFQGGCPVPIPTFITALQCFSASTVCSAPPDLCQAIYETCVIMDENPGGCKDRGIIPFVISPVNKQNQATQWSFTIPGTTTNPVDICNADASGQSAGAAWYYLPPQSAPAFGSQFGQYGVNPWTDYADEATGQFMCGTPTTVSEGVPGVPGVTSNTNVDPPCSILGNLARFHGQTSNYYNTIINTGGSSVNDFPSICLSNAQQTIILNSTPFTTFTAQCDSTFSTFSAAASFPGIGLPPNWVPNNPQMWVHQNYFMTSSPQVDDISLEIQLLISGAGLDAEIVAVENGEFTQDGQFCSLLQNSASGFANISIQNTGSQKALYQVKLTNCTNPASTSNTNLVNNPTTNDNIACQNGHTASTELSITLSSLPGVNSLLCSFELRPEANLNILLQTMSLNCVVQGFLQTTGPGIVEIDGKFIPPAQGTFSGNACEDSSNPGWGCWLIYGGWLAHSFFIFFLSLIAICSIVILVNGCRIPYSIQLWIDNSRRYNQTMEEYQAQLAVQQEKTIEKGIVLAKGVN